MNKISGIQIIKPIPVLRKSIKVNFKDFTKALGKAGSDIAFGKWDSLAGDGLDALGALGLSAGVEETAWLLIYRSLLQAMKRLVDEKTELDPVKLDINTLKTQIDEALSNCTITINNKFFQHPEKDTIIEVTKPSFVKWLQESSSTEAEAEAIGKRLPIYFAEALHEEWGDRPKDYSLLRDKLDTPFTQANDRLKEWMRYSSWLQKQVEEPLFLEAFSLKQVFVPLRAYFNRNIEANVDDVFENSIFGNSQRKRIVVDLVDELDSWLKIAKKDDAIRLISGGPGSGKSSFAKMYASKLSEKGNIPVLFVPLHHFEPSNDLVDALGKFVQVDGIFKNNPLTTEHREERILIIFDGLDELAMQGKLAEKIAQDFVREVCRKVERFNMQKTFLQVLITGRELVVQANENDFRKEGQILHVLPYFVPESEYTIYVDVKKRLKEDQRQLWWQLYGKATGNGYTGLPAELDQGNLADITSQPLLNYLVALSLRRGKMKFSEKTNMNTVYADLLKAIYERGWDGYQHTSIKGVEEKDFIRILEEIALSSWHGDGRTTTIKEIEKHCDNSGLKNLLFRFQDGIETDPKTKVTSLLTAFYFRHSGYKESEKTFEFTHKSFGEYLTARRIIREVKQIHKKLEDRRRDLDEGCDERDALLRWALICGPSATDEYLFNFICDEVQLHHLNNPSDTASWQQTFCQLIEFEITHGMPMERLNPRPDYQEESRQSRNGEEALLIVLNSFARHTQIPSKISWCKPDTFGTWISRIYGQREFFVNETKLQYLSFLDLGSCSLNARDLWHANLQNSILKSSNLVTSDCRYAIFINANLQRTNFTNTNLAGADFTGADLRKSEFIGARLKETTFINAILENANLRGTDLRKANFNGADLRGADLRGADLRGTRFDEANLEGVKFEWTRLKGASFEGAKVDMEKIEALMKASIVYDSTGIEVVNSDGIDTDWDEYISGDYEDNNIEPKMQKTATKCKVLT